jgi:hypothetical protein
MLIVLVGGGRGDGGANSASGIQVSAFVVLVTVTAVVLL